MKSIIYKNFSRERFEDLEERIVKMLVLDNDTYKYSRINDSIMKMQSKTITISSDQQEKDDVLQFKCVNCKNKIPKTSQFCQHCGQKVESCPICKSVLLTETVRKCPHCETAYHERHIKEVVKVSGKCPVCKKDLQENELM